MNKEANVENKYLEKIAGLLGNVLGGLAPIGRALGKSVSTGAKFVGEQVHLATGGAQRDFAYNFAKNNPTSPHFAGMTDPNKLAQMSRSDFHKNLWRSIPKDMSQANPTLARKMQYRDTVKNLQTTTNSARLNLGLMAGGTAIAGNSLLNHIGNNNNDAYYQ